MTPLEKVRSYVHRYMNGAYIIDSGWDEVYIYAVECPINDTCKMDI